MRYKLVAVGGTFDRLHDGHKTFLRFAFSKGRRVLIGLTSDEYVSRYKSFQIIQSFKDRKKNLELFLRESGFLDRSEIISIDDKFGPVASDKYPIEALIATNDTILNVRGLNKKRLNSGIEPLNVVIMDKIAVANIPISSSGIRKGSMNRSGDLILPKSLRAELQKPMGSIISDFSYIHSINPDKIVTVGDETTRFFNKERLNQKISVIDFIVNRKKKYDKLSDLGFKGDEYVYKVTNPPGNITYGLSEAINLAIERGSKSPRRIVICVAGEEDLAVIPLVLSLPSSCQVFYGQPGVGIAFIKTNNATKNKFKKIISHFEPNTLGS